jgi:hypothetical protein
MKNTRLGPWNLVETHDSSMLVYVLEKKIMQKNRLHNCLATVKFKLMIAVNKTVVTKDLFSYHGHGGIIHATTVLSIFAEHRILS